MEDRKRTAGDREKKKMREEEEKESCRGIMRRGTEETDRGRRGRKDFVREQGEGTN